MRLAIEHPVRGRIDIPLEREAGGYSAALVPGVDAGRVLDRSRWSAVFDVVRDRLLTPLGLRSLARGHRDFKAQYYGDLRARDAAYHQGTVWAWLAGAFVDVWLKIDPADKAGARAACLDGFASHLNEGGVGTISEIFDAESPYVARGCIAQAWSVAEVLRAWLLTEPTDSSRR